MDDSQTDTMRDRDLEDRMDLLVGMYADRRQATGTPDHSDLLEQVPPEHRPALERCFKMIDAGLAAPPPVKPALVPGRTLAGYRVLEELGRGGMGIVYLAEDLELRRKVALKVLRPGLALERQHVDRFRREGQAIAKLEHPHIVRVYAVGEAEGFHFIAMEYVPGTNLAEVYARLPADGPWFAKSLAAAASIPSLANAGTSYEAALAGLLAPVARAIGLAHELGLVHRDVKPSNILIHPDGRALIADFGLAKNDSDPSVSLTGQPLGTPSYMSPEQAALESVEVDRRTDVYSLGVTLYEGLTGRRPFEAETFLGVLDAIRTRTPPPIRGVRRENTRDAEAVVRRAMARRRDERYASALDLATELTALAEGRPTQARATEGSWLARARRTARMAIAPGLTFEYVSPRRFLGLPLVHIHRGSRIPGQGFRVAKGWFAAGDIAIGGFACGNLAIGGICIGGLGFGLFAFAGIALAGLSVAGIALGVMPNGGISAGYAATGGLPFGYYAMGGLPHGVHTIGPYGTDQQAVDFFWTWAPWWRLIFG